MGEWKFDGNADDSSRSQNHGNLVSGKFVDDREGNPSSALFLNGIDDQVVIPHSESLNPANQLSTSMWLKIGNYTNKWSPIIHKGGAFKSGGINREYSVFLKNNGKLFLWSAGNNSENSTHNSNSVKKRHRYGGQAAVRSQKAERYLRSKHSLLHLQ